MVKNTQTKGKYIGIIFYNREEEKMKKMVVLLIMTILLSGCFTNDMEIEKKDDIIIKEKEELRASKVEIIVNKNHIFANEQDEVSFTVIVRDQNNEIMGDQNVQLYLNDKKYQNNVFATDKIGEYLFKAKLEELESETIKIVAEKINWQKRYGGSGRETLGDLKSTKDGGYIIGGSSNSTDFGDLGNAGYDDIFIMKLDKYGKILWQKIFGGEKFDELNEIIVTEDGGFILICNTSSDTILDLDGKGTDDILILKLSSNGNILWKNRLGGDWSDTSYSYVIDQNSDVIIALNSWSSEINGIINKGEADIFLMKLKSTNGEVLWTHQYGGNKSEFCLDLIESEKGYILVGDSTSDYIFDQKNRGKRDFYIIETDFNGRKVKEKIFGGNGNDKIVQVKKIKDGGFYILGYSESNNMYGLPNNGNDDYYLAKLDYNLNIVEEVLIGGEGEEILKTAYLIEDTEIIIVGESRSEEINGEYNNGYVDINILKVDMDFNFKSTKFYGGSDWDSYHSILKTKENGIILSLASENKEVLERKTDDFFIMNFSNNLEIDWIGLYGGRGRERASRIEQTIDNGYIFGGLSIGIEIEGVKNSRDWDIFIVKTDRNGIISAK